MFEYDFFFFLCFRDKLLGNSGAHFCTEKNTSVLCSVFRFAENLTATNCNEQPAVVRNGQGKPVDGDTRGTSALGLL